MADPIRVLLVDDAKETRLLIRTALRLRGSFSVAGEAADGTHAVALAEQHQPDIVVLDLGLPDLAGHEVLTRIRTVSPMTKVVVFSGADAAEHASIADQVEGYVVKDAELGYLVELLEDVAGRSIEQAELTGLSAPQHVSRAREWVATTLTAWDSGVALMPAARFVTSDTPSTSSPQWRAAIASIVVDMPTRSAPSAPAMRTSAGVS